MAADKTLHLHVVREITVCPPSYSALRAAHARVLAPVLLLNPGSGRNQQQWPQKLNDGEGSGPCLPTYSCNALMGHLKLFRDSAAI
jgi:hypothetical protein